MPFHTTHSALDLWSQACAKLLILIDGSQCAGKFMCSCISFFLKQNNDAGGLFCNEMGSKESKTVDFLGCWKSKGLN